MTKVSDVKIGQHVRFTVEGVVTSAFDTVNKRYLVLDRDGSNNGREVYIGRDHPSLETLEVIPDPIKVGDTVNTSFGKGITKGIDGGFAFVKLTPKRPGIKDYVSVEVEKLTLVTDCNC